MSRTTLLLPNYNNERALPAVFDCLRRHQDCSGLELVFADDGSEDASVAVAKKCATACGFARAEILDLGHRGIVCALNDGLAAARTECVVRVDGDATVETRGWVDLLTAPLRLEEVGLASGQVIWETGEVHSFGRSVFSETGLHDMGCVPLEPAGARTFDSIVHRPRRGFLEGPPREVDAALGVCAAFRREDALAVGGFDERFNPVWIEDDDFALALRGIGRRVILEPRVRVVHRPSLRGSRKPGVVAQRLEAAGRGGFRRLVPERLRALARGARKISTSLAFGRRPAIETLFPREMDEWRCNILRGHYLRWREKWGFDPLNPDMLAVFERHWDTRLCWRNNPREMAEARLFASRLVRGLG